MSFRTKSAIRQNVGSSKYKLQASPIFCKTIEKEVSGTKEEVMKEMGDLSARCWWMFLEAKYDDLLRDITPILPNTVPAFLCYVVRIEEIEDSGKISKNDLWRFLVTEEYEGGLSYIDYIQQGGGLGVLNVMTGLEEKGVYGIAYVDRPPREGNPAILEINKLDELYERFNILKDVGGQ